ncbi:MAG: polyribonucleotide nucleotidyltransferase, partial [Terriglobales bacterium]
MPSSVRVALAGGKTLTLETGKIARQAGGAVTVRLDDTMVLATATSAPNPREGIDFFPLTVDYREYTYASGRFPGGYIKREGRPTEKEVLTSRQIDRPVRPLFAKGFRNETQVVALVLSADQTNDPDVLAVTAAGAALHVSNVPFPLPLAGVRVGYVNGNYICNPTYTEMRASTLNIVVAGTNEGIAMVEAGAAVVSEEVVVGAIEFAHVEIKKIIAGIEELRKLAGAPKRAVTPPTVDETFYKKLFSTYGARLTNALDTKAHPKLESQNLAAAVEAEALAAVPADQPELKPQTKKYFELMRERHFRDTLLDARKRPDGRDFDQIRPINCEVGLLPRAHGSSLFTRGETQ